MKKFIFILSLFISFSCFAQDDNSKATPKQFVNPVFNQTLRPLSTHNGLVYLTPTSVDFRTPLDENLVNGTGKCDLLENEEDHITLLCEIDWLPEHYKVKEYFTYVVDRLYFEGCLLIHEYSYDNPQKFSKNMKGDFSAYCVDPPKSSKLD